MGLIPIPEGDAYPERHGNGRPHSDAGTPMGPSTDSDRRRPLLREECCRADRMEAPGASNSTRAGMKRKFGIHSEVGKLRTVMVCHPRVRFTHCLPAFQNLETKVGRDIHEKFGLAAMELTEEVFEAEMNIAFKQAENRTHAIKAILVAMLGG